MNANGILQPTIVQNFAHKRIQLIANRACAVDLDRTVCLNLLPRARPNAHVRTSDRTRRALTVAARPNPPSSRDVGSKGALIE